MRETGPSDRPRVARSAATEEDPTRRSTTVSRASQQRRTASDPKVRARPGAPRHAWWTARDHVPAARAVGVMTTAASLYTILNGIVSPETMGTRPGGWVVTGTFAVVVVCCGLFLAVAPRRAPGWAPAALAGLAGLMVLVLDLWTDDASFGGQIYLGWPAMFAAFHLRPLAAWLLTAQAVAADVVLMGVEEGTVGIFRDSPAHLVTFCLITALLTTAGERQERLTATLRAQAAEDALTGLTSRRAYDSALAAHVQAGTVDGLLLVDVDSFKAVNDTHGHPTGDAVLRIVAGELRAVCRAEDVVARLGGDEFAVVLVRSGPDSGPDAGAERDLRAVADRFHRAVAASSVPGDRSHRLSISAGIARAEVGESAEDLVARADAALYTAKRAGRDRVVDAPPVGAVNGGWSGR